ncbi:family 16 glycoside hydrolase [uncultured Tenacibaculum sp.]|uniref:family 16 glycoside hydrolase n=1 Tax=uncultured Tenacibaculum sp. TaxID=174713 RepID=UPI002613CB56|nr:family 16 glycoside hydrolase [uncultured Tenacibaculum sp.]
MTKIFYFIITICSIQFLSAQNQTTTIEMSSANWDLPKGAKFEKFDNRKTLILPRSRATVKNLQFKNGTIEVDIYANSKRSFAGITFRKQNNTMEEVYMRMHKANQADAIQYTPIFNNESNWQLYREYQANVSFKNIGWNTLKIDVNNQIADVYVNGNKVLTIDNLRTEQTNGGIGLFALFTNRFSNFRVTHKKPISKEITTKENIIDPTIISQWNITQAKPYTSEDLSFKSFVNYNYSTVKTESSGLLPISKYVKKSTSGNFEQNKEDYIVASKTIHSKKEETKLFSFDYSDKIIVYLNGQKLFKGNNAFRTKGVQYMGHTGTFANQLYLPLKKGKNTIHCVVIDKANGWGLMGKLE